MRKKEQKTTRSTKTYIIGHKKPDLDSVVAPMALTYLYQQEDCFGYENPQPLIADPINPETKYVLEKFGAQTPALIDKIKIGKRDLFVLADHNEPDQRANAIKPNQIVEVVDHHKPNLNLPHPIFINIKVWGSTSTIVWWFMKINNLKPDKQLAGLMLCAILSDTVGLKSPTTTNVDQDAVTDLTEISKTHDVKDLTREIFKAKSNLDKLSIKQKVTNDYKVFDFGGHKLFINQIETVEQEKVLSENKGLTAALQQLKQEKNYDYAYLIVSDLLEVNSKLLYSNEKELKIAQKAFPEAIKVEAGVLDIGKRISRKKQIAPALEKILDN